MAFFPLIDLDIIDGYIVLSRFSPNNWETNDFSTKNNLYGFWSDGETWHCMKIEHDKNLSFIKITTKDIPRYFPNYDRLKSNTVFFSFFNGELNQKHKHIPKNEIQLTRVPQWRAVVGFNNLKSKASYQGEINPFPKNGTLLTFHPFFQFDEKVDNYFLFINFEDSAKYRYGEIKISDTSLRNEIITHKIRTNFSNLIKIDLKKFNDEMLPIFYSNHMTGIPFGLAIHNNGSMMSLEHTHPPSNFSVHGKRFKIQREIKKKWFDLLKND